LAVELSNSGGPNLYDSIIGACHASGFAPSISMESPQISSAANLVSAGFGVAVVPASMRQVQVEGVSYHELKGKPLSTGIALIHRQREKSPAVLNSSCGFCASIERRCGGPDQLVESCSGRYRFASSGFQALSG
jgi:DNA-binding transcriptional LysR family regulator